MLFIAMLVLLVPLKGIADTAGQQPAVVGLAVAPFKNISQNPNYDWLSAAFSETISTRLSQVKSFNLVERSQMRKLLKEMEISQLGLTEKSIEPGKWAGVDILMLGSFLVMGQGEGAKMQVNTRLVDVQKAIILKGSGLSQQAEFKTLFSLQDKIIFQTSSALARTTDPATKKILACHETESLAAYQFYHLALQEQNPHKKVILYKKALSFDSNYALAYLNLASALYLSSYHRVSDIEVEKNAVKALSIQPNLSEGHLLLGSYYERIANKGKGKKQRKQARKKAIFHYQQYIVQTQGEKRKSQLYKIKRAKRRLTRLQRK